MYTGEQIVEAIKRRRDSAFDSQIVGSASDQPEYTAAEVTRAIAEAYDSLLVEIGAITPQEAKSA
jgi:hypothetical protein